MVSWIRMSTLRTLDSCQTTVQISNTKNVFARVKICGASFFRSVAWSGGGGCFRRLLLEFPAKLQDTTRDESKRGGFMFFEPSQLCSGVTFV